MTTNRRKIATHQGKQVILTRNFRRRFPKPKLAASAAAAAARSYSDEVYSWMCSTGLEHKKRLPATVEDMTNELVALVLDAGSAYIVSGGERASKGQLHVDGLWKEAASAAAFVLDPQREVDRLARCSNGGKKSKRTPTTPHERLSEVEHIGPPEEKAKALKVSLRTYWRLVARAKAAVLAPMVIEPVVEAPKRKRRRVALAPMVFTPRPMPEIDPELMALIDDTHLDGGMATHLDGTEAITVPTPKPTISIPKTKRMDAYALTASARAEDFLDEISFEADAPAINFRDRWAAFRAEQWTDELAADFMAGIEL